jgi:hypothetical protein
MAPPGEHDMVALCSTMYVVGGFSHSQSLASRVARLCRNAEIGSPHCKDCPPKPPSDRMTACRKHCDLHAIMYRRPITCRVSSRPRLSIPIPANPPRHSPSCRNRRSSHGALLAAHLIRYGAALAWRPIDREKERTMRSISNTWV